MIYEFKNKNQSNKLKGKIVLGVIIFFIFALLLITTSIYIKIIQLNEIGNLASIFITNLQYKIIFGLISFIIILLVLTITNIFIKKNIQKYSIENSIPIKRFPYSIVSLIIASMGAISMRDYFYQKALNFLNGLPFGSTDPIFSKDIGYYIFQRPFLMSGYQFISTLWLFVIAYTVAYYILFFFSITNNVTINEFKDKNILKHNLINIAIFFGIKAISYKFMKEGILYSQVVDSKGANYIDVNIWLKYFNVAPFLLIVIVILAFIFLTKGDFKKTFYSIAIFPVIWVLVFIISMIVQSLVVSPNEKDLQSQYLKYNIEKTREAYKIDKIQIKDFPNTQELTPDIINRNLETKNNIRVVDYNSTLVSDIQLQSNTNFYTFNDGDIVNYTINGKETPVFITAREIDKNKLPDKSYLNTTYRYTHGYGVVINPINKLTPAGQIDFILSGLRLKSTDETLNIIEPRIYYGELTKDNVIVNAANGLNEIDNDGNETTRYNGTGGIKLNTLNRLIFALKYSDIKLITSGYPKDATLLLNRQVIERAKLAVPFLRVDNDPYIVLTDEGKLVWVIDGYTASDDFPYSESYGGINYIRNSVKIVVDAYNGDTKYYIIDENDPMIKTYKKIYPGIFSEKPIPESVAKHMRYPELLFKVQTEMLKKYHLEPKDVDTFYSQQDLWDIAQYPEAGNTDTTRDIDPYYNMIKLPLGLGDKEELILMRPFTPSGELKHNMVSWLALRNSYENYGEMILFNFPKNTNIFGPNQVEVKINQIDEVSKDMTLWGQRGTDVYKGSLLVIPIENSVLYIEPIYIRASGTSSIPEVRKIVAGYQKGDEFIYGIGTNLDSALKDLFKDFWQNEVISKEPTVPEVNITDKTKVDEIISKFNELKKQLDELGNLINKLQ